MGNAQRNDDSGFRFAFDLGDRLDKAMRVAGLSIDDMADALGVSRNTVGNYRAGRTSPSKLQVKEWAIRTGAPLTWLMTGDQPETEKAPTPEGEGPQLPGLDSNQEPIGFKQENVVFAEFGKPQRNVIPQPVVAIGDR